MSKASIPFNFPLSTEKVSAPEVSGKICSLYLDTGGIIWQGDKRVKSMKAPASSNNRVLSGYDKVPSSSHNDVLLGSNRYRNMCNSSLDIENQSKGSRLGRDYVFHT